MPVLQCGNKALDLSESVVMGILNVTPDSFSDGGCFIELEAALAQARQMVVEGASIIDIGGESTRPGAQAVSVATELERVIPLIGRLAQELSVPISIDSSKPEVMRAAVEAGAGMVNDVFALQAPKALETVAELKVPVCLMHMQGEPRTMQKAPHYEDVVREVADFLNQRVAACLAAGIEAKNILLDPGFGFGKSLQHNLVLLKNVGQLRELGFPLLVGLSRKRMIAAVLKDAPLEARLQGSVAAALMAVVQGAKIVRVHDVKATAEALAICRAVNNA
ncbi:MAG: dihydropteroate synthase [Gammaproteobacteria bacterium]|nr:dihydropteroate synthase [Gammaproteobacteria bacterium]